VLRILLLAALLPAPSRQEPEPATPSDAAALTAELLERPDDADPGRVRELAALRTAEALDGLIRFYDAAGSLYMRRIALRGLAQYGGIADLEPRALQKLTDIATLSFETELRETAVDQLADCAGGRAYLAAIVDSDAHDAVRERALRLHVAHAQPEDVEWYARIHGPGADRADKKKKNKRDEKGGDPAPVYGPALREIAFEGLADSLSSDQLAEAVESKLVGVRRRALELLAARRDPRTADHAERMLENRRERPDVRLLAAQILLDVRGPEVAEQLYKNVRRGEVPLELAFGVADLLAGLDDPRLRGLAVKALGQGQELEQRFHLRMAARVPDPKVDKALLELADDESQSVAVDALLLMGVRANPAFVPRLEKILKQSKDPARLGAAIQALDRIHGNDPEWRAKLAGLARSDVEVVRNSALEALGKRKDESHLAVVLAALDHPSWTTRLTAARALEELHVADGVGALCARIGKEEGRMVGELADILWRMTAQPFRSDGAAWARWWAAEGADFRFPTPEELRQRQQERDLRADKQVSRSFRGVKVESRFFGLRITSHNVAFVVDVSGSMEERLPGAETGTRMQAARRELMACIEALEGGTRFNILPFANSVTPWMKSAVECTEETFAEAQEFLEGLGALGGTNIHAGLELAFEDPSVDTVYFLSDGEPSVGDIVDPAAIRETVGRWNEQRGVVIHTIAIGERFPLLEWLAADSGGTYRTFP
jgi:HEAT repeat protein/Mg-chelatase subunit ChlD